MIRLLSARHEVHRAAAHADRQRRRLHHSSHRLMTATKKRLTAPGSLALSFSAGAVTGVLFGGRDKPKRPRKPGKFKSRVKKSLSTAAKIGAGRIMSLFASEVAETLHHPAAAQDTAAGVAGGAASEA